MTRTLMKAPVPRLAHESVVTLASESLPVHGPDTEVPGSRRLGPGFVRDTDAYGHVSVHWMERDFNSWMDPAELAVLPAAYRLLSVFRCPAAGSRVFERHLLVSSKGLEHNWIVELLPDDIVRTERSDGAAWTFNWFPILRRVELIRTMGLLPEEDAEAEAVTVAEIAVGLHS